MEKFWIGVAVAAIWSAFLTLAARLGGDGTSGRSERQQRVKRARNTWIGLWVYASSKGVRYGAFIKKLIH
jgi:hypothetical protein